MIDKLIPPLMNPISGSDATSARSYVKVCEMRTCVARAGVGGDSGQVCGLSCGRVMTCSGVVLTPTGPIQYKLKKRPKGDENLKVRGWLYLSYGLVDDFSDADSMVSIINDAEKKVNNDGADVSEFLKSVNWIAAVGQQDLAEKIANAVIAQTVDGKGEDSVAASTIRDLVGGSVQKVWKVPGLI